MRFVLLAAALLATPALAADKPAPSAKTAAAVSPRIKAEFARSDANKDGFLTRAEVQARVQRMDVGRSRMSPAQVQMLASTWFTTADTNRDAKVSPAEMQRLLARIAGRYDTNGDGVVSVAERQAARGATLGEVTAARKVEPGR
jgi:Ca2+-binding EF-hand superfamily protein